MARCGSCNRRIGLFSASTRKYSGHAGQTLCKQCALVQQKRKFAERLEYKLKMVEAYPSHVEPLRDCEMDMHFIELLLESDQPLGASRSREMEKLKKRYAGISASDLFLKRDVILDSCRKLVDQLKPA